MRSMVTTRRSLTLLAVVAALAAGVAIGSLTSREAQAQSLSMGTVYVPAGGLVFRAPDGTPLARLSRDAHGGRFELFDDRHDVSMSVPTTNPNAQPPLANPHRVEGDPSTRDEVF